MSRENKNTVSILWLALVFVLAGQAVLGQEIAEGVYWVYFTDKNNNGFNLNEPGDFLSARSLERRGWQGMGIDQTDLPVTGVYVDEIRNMGIEVRHVSRWLNGIAMVNINDTRFQEVLQKPFVDTLPWKPQSQEAFYPPTPSGTRFEPPLDLPPAFDYGIATEQILQLEMDALHQEGYTGAGVWIGLLDAGFRNADSLPSFESMISEGRLLGTRNFVSDTSVYRLRSNHGMYVLSITGASWDGYMVGTAPDASFYLAATENIWQETRIEEIAWIEGAEYLDSLGIDVINTSLGYSNFDGTSFDYSYEDMDGKSTFISRAASLCAGKGIVVSASAGNSGLSDWYRITAPADAKDILAVGAVDSTGQIASFSSRGPSFDGRLNPNVVAMGRATGIQHWNGQIGRGNGTSFSSPLIAGAAASLWQAYPELSAMDLIFRIRESGDRLLNPDATYGYGIPSFKQALWMISGTQEHSAEGHLFIFPNPGHDKIRISIPAKQQGAFTVSLYDLSGRQILSNTLFLPGELHIPAGTPPGIYILQAASQNSIFRNRFIIQ